MYTIINMGKPYDKFVFNQLSLRDQLAIDRTILANERTYLSYIRTALNFMIVGLTLIKFFDSTVLEFAGGGMLFFSIISLLDGTRKYMKMKSLIEQSSKSSDPWYWLTNPFHFFYRTKKN